MTFDCEYYSNNCDECLSKGNCMFYVFESGVHICSKSTYVSGYQYRVDGNEAFCKLLQNATTTTKGHEWKWSFNIAENGQLYFTVLYVMIILLIMVVTHFDLWNKSVKIYKTVTMLLKSVKNPQVGTPKLPDPSLYSHLTEKERMTGGWPYNASDPELQKIRIKADELNWEFNNTKWDNESHLRKIISQLFHPSCKDVNLKIEPPFRADFGENIIVGNNFYANVDCLILDCAKVEIGNDCMFGPGVHIYTVSHGLDYKFRRDWGSPTYFEVAKEVKIGNDCWIGGKVIICPGVTIGNNVVVGAGSVVTKDIPSNVVVGGNPAKIIRYLDGAVVPNDN